MIKFKKIILVFIFIISLVNLFITICFYNNIYKEENKKVIGKITYIKYDSDKTVIDIKNKKKYRITLYKEAKYNYGDVVSVDGLFKTAPNNTVFNLFNYNKYLLSKKIIMVSSNPNIKLIKNNTNILYKIKNRMIKHIDNYQSKKYIKAFVMGDTNDIEDNVLTNYRNIGISHLLAISGMHLSLFLIIINSLFKKNRFKDLIIFSFLIFLLFITNYPESLIRCFLFIILKYINKRLKLNYNNLELLIFCFSILILYNPYFIYNIGFIFSIVITFFILLSKNILKDKSYFKKLAITSLICFFASIPIIANSFFKINLLTPLFNIIFVPIISIIIFPLGLLTFVFSFLDGLYFIITSGMESVINVFSDIGIFNFVVSKPNLIIVLIYYISLFFSIKISKKYIFLFLVILIININSRFLIRNPEITFLDVEQGDSSIIILPYGKTIMIDTGGIYGSECSIALNKTIPYLNSRGINEIDTLILTHGDYDHMGEAVNLIKNINVKNILINKGNLNDLEKKIMLYKNVTKVKENYIVGNYEFSFLNNGIYDNENDNSIVTYLNIRNNNILFMGDSSKKIEKNIINEYNLPKMDILKVGHHGSKTSSSKEFINVVNPTYSVISVGLNNRYHHPNDETLEILKNTNIIRTDTYGSIRFVFRKNMVNKFTCEPYTIVERFSMQGRF